jgi:hypothetical protein
VGTTINFIDPLKGTSIAVHFDNYAELVHDLHKQQTPWATTSSPWLSYEVAIELVEA